MAYRKACRIGGDTYLTTEEDIQWCMDVHLTKPVLQKAVANGAPQQFLTRLPTSIMLVGSEDCPAEIWGTLVQNPLYTSRFWLLFSLAEEES